MELRLYINTIYNWIVDSIFPELCLGCSKKGQVICINCLTNIRLAERETATNIYAAYDYRDPIIKKAIWSLKYYSRRFIGEILGKMLYESMIEEISDMRSITKGQKIVVVPVPLSRNRKKKRGYNQAESIARHFCNCNKEIFNLSPNLLSKKIDTSPQARISNRNSRLNNIHGAFIFNANEDIKGRTIIIIDDVTTTGGTISEIMKILRKAGAKKVVGFALAH